MKKIWLVLLAFPWFVLAQENTFPLRKWENTVVVIACFAKDDAMRIAEAYVKDGEAGKRMRYKVYEKKNRCMEGMFTITYDTDDNGVERVAGTHGVGNIYRGTITGRRMYIPITAFRCDSLPPEIICI